MFSPPGMARPAGGRSCGLAPSIGWAGSPRPAAPPRRGLRRMVGRTGPDPGSLAAGRPSDVGQDHLPRLALAALPVHAIGQEIIARRDGRSRLAATARAAFAATLRA